MNKQRLKKLARMVTYYVKQRDVAVEQLARQQRVVQQLGDLYARRQVELAALQEVTGQNATGNQLQTLTLFEQCAVAMMRCQRHLDQAAAQLAAAQQQLKAFTQLVIDHDRRIKAWEKLMARAVADEQIAEHRADQRQMDEHYLAHHIVGGQS